MNPRRAASARIRGVARRLVPPAARRAYLIGTNFSGSTLFGQAIGAAPSARYLGEVDRLVDFEATRWADEPVSCHYCELREQPCPVWTPDRVSRARQGHFGDLMPFVEAELGDRIMVDGSKHPQWFRQLYLGGALDRSRSVVFLTVRSPFAFVDSFRFRMNCAAWEAANVWRDVNYDALRLIAETGLPAMVVRYEDFALDPERVLRPACSLLGLDYRSELLYFQHVESHDLGGNYNVRAVVPDQFESFEKDALRRRMPGLYQSSPTAAEAARRPDAKPFGGWLDAKWQTRLSADDVEEIIQTPGLVDLANQLGYQLRRDVSAWRRRQPA